MPRKYQNLRYRLQTSVSLEILSEIEIIAREEKKSVSRCVEGLLLSGVKDYYTEREKRRFQKDLEDVKIAEKLLGAKT